MDCTMPGLPVHHQLPEFTQTHVHWVMRWPSSHLILCCPLLLLPSIFPSIKVFSNESVLCIRWPKYWSFSFNISPSSEYSGLISFRMDWLDLLAVQGTLKSLPQHHSSKASTLQCSAFFKVKLLHPYMTTGKTIALTRWTFVGKVMSYGQCPLNILYTVKVFKVLLSLTYTHTKSLFTRYIVDQLVYYKILYFIVITRCSFSYLRFKYILQSTW